MNNACIPSYVIATTVEDIIVLLDLRNNNYYALKDSAVEYWRALEKTNSTCLALEEILNMYTDSKISVKEDMESFVHSLVQTGLLKRIHSSS